MTLMGSFREALIENSPTDLGVEGPTFTWNNKRKDQDNVMERLDRFVANQTWTDACPSFRVINMDYKGSDNRPIKLITNPSTAISTVDKKMKIHF